MKWIFWSFVCIKKLQFSDWKLIPAYQMQVYNKNQYFI